MARYAYLLFNGAIALSLVFAVLWLPLFWRQWRGIARGLVAVSVPFIIWDILAARAGHWQFNHAFTLGADVWGLPVEEVLFFVTVPLGCMVVWTMLGRARNANTSVLKLRQIRLMLLTAVPVLLGLGVFAGSRSYTRLALLAAALACIVLAWRIHVAQTKRFVLFQLCAFGLFFMCNTILTGLPIITYGAQAVTGWKVGTIPIEDFLYNFALLNLFLVAFTGGSRPARKTAQTAVL